MRAFITSLLSVWLLWIFPLAFGQVQPQFVLNFDDVKKQPFESWVIEQKRISFESMLQNIGGFSSGLSPVVPNGVVIASPSNANPDYFYQWTRDSALTINTLVLHIADLGFVNVNEISNIVEDYIENQYHLQRIDNLSGAWNDSCKVSLGEPKFLFNNTAFNGIWGRPQLDGPGLRATSIMHYVNILEHFNRSLSNDFLNDTITIYNEIIKPDLIFIVCNWNKTGFDLWEEVDAYHFFTSLTQLCALSDGLSMAQSYMDLEDFIKRLQSTFDDLSRFIQYESGFISDHPYILETPHLVKTGKRSGLDAASLLASIHTHPLNSPLLQDNSIHIPFNTNSSHLLNTLDSMVADMKYRYPINYEFRGKSGCGAALGRYPEDIYDGYSTSEGNPWFISTATAAEVAYRYVYQLKTNQDDIVLSEDIFTFLRQFINSKAKNNDVIEYGSAAFNSTIDNLFKYADSYLQIIKDHVDDRGYISEQFNRHNGFLQGARQLTWSHSAVWNAIRWREFCVDVMQR
jgi:glucoamylase